MGRIVVGSDGSEGGNAALGWAIEEAKIRQARLEVVHAWQPMSPTWSGLGAMGTSMAPPIDVDELRSYAQSILDAVLAARAEELAGVDLDAHLVEGHPIDVLVDAAKGADLLVVGSRGLGGFRGALLGSVSQHVGHHTRCPVVIVPHPRHDDPVGSHAA
jgi:nucleotide-binding universal stress UspA family protein